MTDVERNRIEAICNIANVKDIGDLSDGFHTFNQLYYQRMMLFAVIVRQNKDKAWKSFRHEDGELCFGGGWFIVGVDTPEGSYTYHYEAKYFDLFDCDILDYGKHWDGHTEKDVTRLLSLTSAEPDIIRCKDCKWWDRYGEGRMGYCHAIKHNYYTTNWEIHILRTYRDDFYCADAEPREEAGDSDE